VGLIQAPPEELMRAGASVEALTSSISTFSCLGGSFGSGPSDPPETAAALAGLGSAWTEGAARLDDELTALGRAVQASAIAYVAADEGSMRRGGP
jgi:hypothetical protein